MKRLLAALLVAPLLVLIAACGGSSTVTANEFDTSCSSDKDCVAVRLGDLCERSGCNCPSGAINTSSQKAYQTEAESILASCTTPQPTRGCLCAFHPLTCEGGVCVLH